MAKVSDRFKMEGITFIAHGGPGSGRYPKGSGKKYVKKQVKKLNNLAIDYQIKKYQYNNHFRNASRIAFKLNTKDLSYKKGSRLEKRFMQETDKQYEIKKQAQDMSNEYDKIIKHLREKMGVKLMSIAATAVRPNIITPWYGDISIIPYKKVKVVKKIQPWVNNY